MPGLSLVYSTLSSRDEALSVGRALVAEKLAACANVLDGMTSIYHWQGAIQQDAEAVLLAKTRTELVPAVMERIRQLHRYDCPAILSWELQAVSADYTQWLLANTLSPPTH